MTTRTRAPKRCTARWSGSSSGISSCDARIGAFVGSQPMPDQASALAAFVKAQRRIVCAAYDNPCVHLQERCLDLWHAHHAEWLGIAEGVRVIGFEFRRGLLDHLRLEIGGDDLPPATAQSPCLTY